MQFPESWLREFCDPPLSTAQLAELLTMSGMEVEELRPAAPAFTGVVVGEIVECGPHPGADKLRVCRVQAGSHSRDGALQVVCGAPNARVGLRAPLALVGASLPPAVGADIRQTLALDDTLFTLKLTPNLGHCLSVYGVAREVAALTG
ncbi:MAG: phenylalanine--tRNA ligase subunit beta, partial [Burkholderiaceae bacterium]